MSIDLNEALLNACRHGSTDKVKLLLEQGVDVNGANVDGTTALMFACACRKGAFDIVELLLEAGADVNSADKDGITALMIAASHDFVETVDLLLEYGAIDKEAALGMASFHNSFEVVQYLLELGTDVNVVDKSGKTALMAACFNGHEKIVQLLLHHNADIERISSKDGENALLAACHSGSAPAQVVSLLLDHGANVDVANINGTTPLMRACTNNLLDIVTLLLSHHANVNAKDKRGITALMLAAYSTDLIFAEDPDNYRSPKIVKLLLSFGADKTITNNDGVTAFRIARSRKALAIAKLLSE